MSLASDAIAFLAITAGTVLSAKASWLSAGGAIAAAGVGWLVWLGGGVLWILPLSWFFLSGTLLGRLPPPGPKSSRTAAQVVSNGGVAAAFAGASLLGAKGAVFGLLGSLACAAADTWATELGNRFGRGHFRLLSLKRSSAGPSGTVSLTGFSAAVLGAASVSAFGFLLQLPATQTALCALVGFLGCVLDSVLGDSVQREGIRVGPLTNNSVNLLSTLAAGMAAYFLAS